MKNFREEEVTLNVITSPFNVDLLCGSQRQVPFEAAFQKIASQSPQGVQLAEGLWFQILHHVPFFSGSPMPSTGCGKYLYQDSPLIIPSLSSFSSVIFFILITYLFLSLLYSISQLLSFIGNLNLISSSQSPQSQPLILRVMWYKLIVKWTLGSWFLTAHPQRLAPCQYGNLFTKFEHYRGLVEVTSLDYEIIQVFRMNRV